MYPRTQTCLIALPSVVLLALVACADNTRPGFDGTKPAENATTDAGPNTGGFGTTEDAGVGADGCSEDAKLVYVLSLEGDLYSFAPAAKKFTKIGPLNCKSGPIPLVPISMGVDRSATAWVNMREDSFAPGPDKLFKVDTKTAKCTPTGISGSMGGMGFSTNEGTTDKETLYVIGSGPSFQGALHRVDFDNEELVPIADLQEQIDLELTGTGDGKLYGFQIDNPLRLARMDKKTTALSQKVTLTGVEIPRAPMFAFSFWGGDFYFYTATDPTGTKTTNVTRYSPADDKIDTKYMQSIGFHIVGAGVSTCAPTSAPK